MEPTANIEALRPTKTLRFKRWTPFLVTCMFVLLLAGCTNKQEIPGGIKVSYQSWVAVVAVAVGLLATIGGWFAKNSGFRGWIFFIFAVLGLLLFSPFGFVDHVTVTQEKINTQWGFWVAPTKHEIQFEDIKFVALTEKTKRSRRGKTTSYYFEFNLKDGSREELIASNSLMERATEAIVEQLTSREIHIVDRTKR